MKVIAKVGTQVIAETDQPLVIEGNYYFPPKSIFPEFFKPAASQLHTICPWKGEASYYDIVVPGKVIVEGAWYYPNPLPDSLPKVASMNQLTTADFTDYVAFYTNRGVTIENTN